jgi:hypothetical protein
LSHLPKQAKPKNKKDPTFNTFQTKRKPNPEYKRAIIILEAERRAYCGNKAMLARLRAWKAKEVQERA